MLLGIFDWVVDFFMSLLDLIPKTVYMLYASLACLLDVFQLFFRKLAGLDVYYMGGKAVGGDIVTNFIAGILGIQINKTDGVVFHYGALSTVFWSMVLFGIIICLMAIFVSVIKSHYTYDDKAAKGPLQYVYTGAKSIINMLAVPIFIVLGLYVSQALLTALDSITSVNSGSIEALYGSDKMDLLEVHETASALLGVGSNEKSPIYYDIFGISGHIAYGNKNPSDKAVQDWVANDYKEMYLVSARTQPFSGSLFRVVNYNANRARLGQMDINKQFLGSKEYTLGAFVGDSRPMTLFGNATDSEELAEMIDTAFACNLHTKGWYWLTYDFEDIVSFKYFTNFLTLGARNFSKFNVGLVWYYYDLWQMNFLVGFAGLFICLGIFINIILGMISRIFMCVVLFLISPPIFGLTPLDGGEAAKSWRKNFVQQAIMAYGAVVGMNLVLMILPFMNEIDFFNLKLVDTLAQTLVIITGLVTIKAVIATVSGLAGGADANKSGEDISKDVGKAMVKGALATGGAMAVGAGVLKSTWKRGGSILDKIGAKSAERKAEDFEIQKNIAEQTNSYFTSLKEKEGLKQEISSMNTNNMSKRQINKNVEKLARKYGLSNGETNALKEVTSSDNFRKARSEEDRKSALNTNIEERKYETLRNVLDLRDKAGEHTEKARVKKEKARVKGAESTEIFKENVISGGLKFGGTIGKAAMGYSGAFGELSDELKKRKDSKEAKDAKDTEKKYRDDVTSLLTQLTNKQTVNENPPGNDGGGAARPKLGPGARRMRSDLQDQKRQNEAQQKEIEQLKAQQAEMEEQVRKAAEHQKRSEAAKRGAQTRKRNQQARKDEEAANYWGDFE